MNDTTLAELAQKNLIQSLDLVKSDRPDSQTPEGFKPEQWHSVCNGQLEILITNTIDLVAIMIRKMEDAMQAAPIDDYEPPKRGRYKGRIDDMVENGDYV